MALRIGFDIDGVFADMEAELLRQAAVALKQPTKRRLEERSPVGGALLDGDAPDTSAGQPSEGQSAAESSLDNAPLAMSASLTARQQRRLWRHVESIENFWQRLQELEPGVVGRLAALALERRWEIIFLTRRPETAGSTAQVQSQRWLESKGFALPSVFVVQGSRGRIAGALALDIVVDDRPENCIEVVGDSRARAILVWREDEKHLPATARRLGIGVVKTTGECLDIITQIDSASKEDDGMMGRVMRLLGFKEPASA